MARKQGERNQRVFESVQATHSFAETARLFNISRQRVQQIVLKLDPTFDVQAMKEAALKQKFERLLAEGCTTVDELAAATALWASAVREKLKAFGLTLPKRQPSTD